MKFICGKSTSIVPALLAVTILLIAPPAFNGQRGSGSENGRPSPDGTLKTSSPQPVPSIRERQFKILEMEREAAKPRTPEGEKLALAQIAEDFERIQVINNKMMSTAMSVATPDYARIAETTAEIRKRAKRIRDNLRLPKADSDEATKRPEHMQAVDDPRMKAALISLDGSITSFIKNPIFKEPGVVDVQHAARAGRDLEIIIEFSQLIGEDADRLRKRSAKSR